MPKLAMKALLTSLTLRGSRRQQFDFERIVTIASTAVSIGLVAAYLYGKSTSRW
jgi:hypothetical protein